MWVVLIVDARMEKEEIAVLKMRRKSLGQNPIDEDLHISLTHVTNNLAFDHPTTTETYLI